ncbi:MAG: crossover junction endodeoxyribonuclease RuvC [Betaproteobacteria bacterium]|nr:MAG: crossover junction endodeoxyribonuclease RuvC [Betaproteobacteria bacterium]
MPEARLILGIDPGLRATGFGLIQSSGSKLAYVASGCIRSNSDDTLPERLRTLATDIQSIIGHHHPDDVAVEKVFVNVNPQSTLLLGQARGAVITAAVLCDVTVYEYTALQVKQAVVGHGKAAKEQVQEMVKRLLRLNATPQADAADALATAITHAHARQGLGAVASELLASKKVRQRGGRLI